MASYFIKGKIYYNERTDIGHTKTMIIDFDKFEKVDSTSIYKKINEIVNNCIYKIEDITKL
jgi:hypothetical protein